jgi:predicted Zn-dependent protease
MDSELAKARTLLARGRPKQARRACDAPLTQHPDEPTLLALIARLDAEANAIPFNRAAEIIQELIAREPDNPRLLLAAAMLTHRRGDVVGALSRVRQLADEYPDDQMIHLVLGAWIRDDAPEAWRHFAQALPAGPLWC